MAARGPSRPLAAVLVGALALLYSMAALSQGGRGLEPPQLVRYVEAAYPTAALAERLTVTVVATLYIDATGTVIKVEVTEPAEPAGYGFDEAAVAAMEGFGFEPARKDGAPIASKIQFAYAFEPPPEPEPLEVEPLEAASDGEDAVPAEPVEPALSLAGQILEAGTRRPLAGVLISFEKPGEPEATVVEVYSDAGGRVEVRGLSDGTWKITVQEEEFGEFSTEETLASGEVVDVTYYLERRYYEAYGTDGSYVYETRARRLTKEVNRRTLEVAEIQRVPGNQGDALKVVQNLPGVARSTFNSGQLVVRGSAPQDTIVLLDGAPIPLLYHFGGLTSVVNSDILSSIDFYPGNFSARYGRAMGGILEVKTRAPRQDRLSGYADVDVIDAALFLEGPITEDITFQASARRSYFDAIIPLVVPEDAGLEFTVAPRYWDYQGRLNWQVAPRHELEVFSYGSDDVLEFVLDEPRPENPQVRGSAEFWTNFHRGQVTYRYRGDRVENTFVYNVGSTLLSFAVSDFARFTLDLFSHTFREELTVEATRALRLRAGWDIQLTDASVAARLPDFPQEGEFAGGFESRTFVTIATQAWYYTPAAFVEAELQVFEPLLVVLGGRLAYDNFVEDFAADLRSTFRYRLNPFWTLKGGVGQFSQAPQPQETASAAIGNPELGWQRAVHYALGTEFRLPAYEPLSFDVTGFYKELGSLVAGTTATVIRDGEVQPLNLDNIGLGRVYGLEVLLRHELANNVFGWISYTLSHAERAARQGAPYRPFDFDQTHILTVIGSWKLPDQWQVGARFRYVTGRPFQPRTGSVFDADADDYSPTLGESNSQRMAAFHQLDLRVDKSWVFETWILSAYLDIQGVYLHENVEAVQYNFDSTEQGYVRNLPILPSLGVKGEF